MKSYTVKKGDTLWKISKAHGVSLEAVIAANPDLANPDVLSVGQVINIPSTPEAASGSSFVADVPELPVIDSEAVPELAEPVVVSKGPAKTVGTVVSSLEMAPEAQTVVPEIQVAEPTPPKWGQMWKYVVKQHDSMWKIAKQAGVSLDQLIAANPQIADPNQIQPGQVLNIPSGAQLAKQKKAVQPTGLGAEIAMSSSPNQKEWMTLPKLPEAAPVAPAPNIMEVPQVETKPKFELPAMEFPKMPNVTIPSINVPINVPVQANDVIEQKTYNIGPVGNTTQSAPVFQGPVQAPLNQAPVMKAPAVYGSVQQQPMHQPYCICKTVVYDPFCGPIVYYHHHILPHYHMPYAYGQAAGYPQMSYPGIQSPVNYGAQQAGAPGELGPYSYQPYQPTTQSATIK